MRLKTLASKVRPSIQSKVYVQKLPDQFYLSKDWRALVARLIKQRGRCCQQCGKTHEDDGSPVRLIGDHIVERRDGGADLDPSNVQLLCSASGGDGLARSDGKRGNCHAHKTGEARRNRASRL